MRRAQRLESKVRSWALAGAAAMMAAALLCLGAMVAVWASQVRRVHHQVDGYTRNEAMAVARMLIYDMASDPRILRAHTLERGILRARESGGAAAEAPDPALLAFVQDNLDWPDAQLWQRALEAGFHATLRQVTAARVVLYRQALADLIAALQDDLWARVTLSQHLRGLRLVSIGGLITLTAGEAIPAGITLPPEQAVTNLSEARLLVVLPLYVETSRWGTAYLLMDRSFLARVASDLTRTVTLGIWALALLLLVLLGTWAWWWTTLLRGLRRDVVEPIVALAHRMEAPDGGAAEGPDVGEPQWLSEAFERMLARMENQQRQILVAQRLGLLERVGAGLSHELNNALNPARLRLEEIALDGRVPTHEDVEALREYLKAAQRILKDLTVAARPSLGPPERLRPSDWLGVARRLVEPHFTGGPKLEWLAAGDEPRVLGDQQALVQVAANLLLNAREALEQRPDGRVTVDLKPEQGSVVLTISDNGPGVPPEIFGHELEPFVTSKARGSGLGLFVVDTLLRRMRGSITLGPAPGGGTSARVVLPAAPENAPLGPEEGDRGDLE